MIATKDVSIALIFGLGFGRGKKKKKCWLDSKLVCRLIVDAKGSYMSEIGVLVNSKLLLFPGILQKVTNIFNHS